jgi:hypothetical protein
MPATDARTGTLRNSPTPEAGWPGTNHSTTTSEITASSATRARTDPHHRPAFSRAPPRSGPSAIDSPENAAQIVIAAGLLADGTDRFTTASGRRPGVRRRRRRTRRNRQILSSLQDDGRMSVTDLASQVRVG